MKPVWKDVIFLESGYTIRFRTRFEHFAGKTVLHCHKLDHEDKGMMQVIRIMPVCPPPEKGPAKPEKTEPAPAVPRPAAAWKLRDADGKSHELREFAGRSLMLVFFRGLDCPHCNAQLVQIADQHKAFTDEGIQVVAIASAKALPASQSARSWPFPILIDEEHKVFKDYGCFDVTPQHAVIAVDSAGQIRWQSIDDEPFTDIKRLLAIQTQWKRK